MAFFHLTFGLLSLSYLFYFSRPQSTAAANFFNDCLGCLNAGNEFCMIIPNNQPGKCCVGMATATDYCDPAYIWCTFSHPAEGKRF